ncbi:MAG TPA: DUF4142 domain-containing protein, partial [Methylocella sp.]|nr:DUF4142 domain-containing protein [Methylocella sp.]
MPQAFHVSRKTTGVPSHTHRQLVQGAGVRSALTAIFMLGAIPLAQAAGPTDPQIAHIAYTAGQLDIAGAKQALSKSTNKDVIAFAE